MTALAVAAVNAANKNDESWNVINAGVRMHAANDTFDGDKKVYGEENLSYKLGYEFHESSAFWQLVANWTPEATGSADIDWAMAPEMNLVFKEGWMRAGTGMLIDYVSRTDGNSEWTGLYWQFLAGLGIPLGDTITLDGYAYYPFSDWNRLNEFDFTAIEYGVNLGFKF
ncbi:MAG: hypothetical protein ACOYOU_13075 [Kiritimatiellia bacterium]